MIAEPSNGVNHVQTGRRLSPSDDASDNACQYGTQPSPNGDIGACHDGAPPSTNGDNGTSQQAEAPSPNGDNGGNASGRFAKGNAGGPVMGELLRAPKPSRKERRAARRRQQQAGPATAG